MKLFQNNRRKGAAAEARRARGRPLIFNLCSLPACAVLGSLHRFLGILIEHYAGKFPLWLAPVQAVVCTITNDADAYADEVHAALFKVGLRAELDTRPEKINAKIRDHSLQKVPLILVVGKKESEGRTVALRRLGGEAQDVLPLDEAVAKLAAEALPPDLANE